MNENYDITVAELKELLEDENPIHLIDVRNPDEYEADNLGGVLIPLGDLMERLEEFEALRGQDIYLQCRSGARSGRAKDILISLGYEKVHNVLGGILAWREQGL